MKERPILISAILLTLVLELILIILVYNRVGGERLPYQLVRLSIQLILIFGIINNKSNIALFLLMAYHILPSLLNLISGNSDESFEKILAIFHICIGLIIYFHDIIEFKLNLKKKV